MIITNITQKNVHAFHPLAPLYLFGELADEFHFAMGAVTVDAEDAAQTAGGVLLYDLIEEDGRTPYILLRWLYVAQEHRQWGIATALMEKFYAVLNQAGISDVMCELPVSPDDDILCAFLEKWGFSFDYQKKNELTISLEELLEYTFFEEIPDLMAVKPLRILSGAQIKAALEQFSVTNEQAMKWKQKEEWEWIDPDVSCAIESAGTIRGLFLVRQQLSGTLEPVFLQGRREKKKEVLDMIQYAAIHAYLKHPSQTPVLILCRSEASAAIVERLFADRQPLYVRHGETVGQLEELQPLTELEQEIEAFDRLL